MHPLNKLLRHVGLQVNKLRPNLPRSFKKTYAETYQKICASQERFAYITREPYCDIGDHPQTYLDFECTFAANSIAELEPEALLDIGSNRHFISGILACRKLTTIDVRDRKVGCSNETVVVSDAKDLQFPDASFDGVLMLCALEHFGLGRYGDELDHLGDVKAIDEIKRVLKPGGCLILSIPMTGDKPFIAFNAHRVYSHGLFSEMCSPLQLHCESFYLIEESRAGHQEELTRKRGGWDVYCGCWRKPA